MLLALELARAEHPVLDDFGGWVIGGPPPPALWTSADLPKPWRPAAYVNTPGVVFFKICNNTIAAMEFRVDYVGDMDQLNSAIYPATVVPVPIQGASQFYLLLESLFRSEGWQALPRGEVAGPKEIRFAKDREGFRVLDMVCHDGGDSCSVSVLKIASFSGAICPS